MKIFILALSLCLFVSMGVHVEKALSEIEGFEESKEAAKLGGEVAGKTRADIEKRLKRSVISKDSYLSESKQTKLRNSDD